MSRMRTRKLLIYIAFVSPAVLFFALFILLPFIRAIIFSFQDWNGISSEIKWAGWSNYKRLLEDTEHMKSFIFTMKYVFVSTILVNLVGFALAFVLNMALKTKNALRTVFFLPHVMGSLVIGFIWQFIITQGFPQITSLTGIEIFQKNWLSIPEYAFWSLILVSVWHYAGYLMVIYLAALQGIPTDLLEAAQIDGANRWHRLQKIIIPLIMPAITVCLFLAISHGFKVFDLNFALTKGGPYGTTESLALHIYLDAFTKNEYTYASAKAVVFFVILASVTVVQVFVMKRKEVEM
ncbi:sugar ABC transporter permease [Paenibacillus sp. WQ 127069]|uniref:Sugar ABC transporter permease n=1 Tax=Paenibacillus baimaensis TaxID=2982185 RepID=A0ABT2UES5_9BACL|nr:sugar ABC transporter permease [Paenibacillus sp. WQ 127069]MCU6793141.1 sugar ABC transporter permease [Paenibacillus sp. WQ 127069]